MEFEFEGPVVEWRGPAPFYFVAIPNEESAERRQKFDASLGTVA